MMFGEVLNQQLSFYQECEFMLRILIAGACGATIGFERTKRLKEAGIRTHILVCCTAALLMIISKYAFGDLENGVLGTRGADTSRIAAQVVSGISFLCAGVILKNGNNIKGLTTAAGLWATAAIGLALGAGMYVSGIFMVLVIIILQVLMHRITFGNDSLVWQSITLVVNDSETIRKELWTFIKVAGGVIENCQVKCTREQIITYKIDIRVKKDIDAMCWKKFIDAHPEVQLLEHTYLGSPR